MIYAEYTTLFIRFVASWILGWGLAKLRKYFTIGLQHSPYFLVSGLTTPTHCQVLYNTSSFLTYLEPTLH